MSIDVSVYQAKPRNQFRDIDYSFKSLQEVKKEFGNKDKDNLPFVDAFYYKENLNGILPCDNLDELFSYLNRDERPNEYFMRAMSVSDVIIVRDCTNKEYIGTWYCDINGFKPISFNPIHADKLDRRFQQDMPDMIKVIECRVGERAVIDRVENSIEGFKKFLYASPESQVEVYPGCPDEGVELVCIYQDELDEENSESLKNLEMNRAIICPNEEVGNYVNDVIRGDFLVVWLPENADTFTSFADLPDDMCEKYFKEFELPEIFLNTLGESNRLDILKYDPDTGNPDYKVGNIKIYDDKDISEED